MDDFEQQLEQQLKAALRRREPPAWFEARVLAGTAVKKPKLAFLRWVAATVSACAIAAGVWTDHREHVEGEAAKARLQLALKVTVTELGKIQRTVRRTEDE
jgi:hypothetical protein